jgi:hypothetical protein
MGRPLALNRIESLPRALESADQGERGSAALGSPLGSIVARQRRGRDGSLAP